MAQSTSHPLSITIYPNQQRQSIRRPVITRTMALETLPPNPGTHLTWKSWTTTIAETTGTRGKSLYMPLRLVLTAESHGPELAGLLPLIGRGLVMQRLEKVIGEGKANASFLKERKKQRTFISFFENCVLKSQIVCKF